MERRIRRELALSLVAAGRRAFRGTRVQQLPLVTAAYRAAMAMGLGPSAEEEVTFRDVVLTIPSRDITILPSLLLQDYETVELDAFLCLVGILGPGYSVLDVGANVGIYSVLSALAVRSDVSVHAFEPIRRNIRSLSRNLERNGIPNVTVVEQAVGRSVGRVQIHRSDLDIGTHSVGGGGDSYEDVPVIPLDEYVRDNELTVGAIKIDVEGYDGYVLEGAKETISRDAPSVLVEYSPSALTACGYPLEQFHREILSIPGDHFWIDNRRRGLVAFRSAGELARTASSVRSSSNILVTSQSEVLSGMILS